MSNDRSPLFVSGQALSRVNFGGMLSLLALVLLALGGPAARADWPEFRGPWGDGRASAPGDAKLLGLPLHWSETNNIKWKTEIPYRGWSTPVVMGGQVWLTTATDDGHDFFAICVDADSGKIRFNEKVFHSDNPEPLGNGASMNCYATPSPVIEPGRVYVHFGSFGTACLDTRTGKALWKRDDLRCRHYRGPSSSLISFENLLILTFDGADLQYLAALDKRTGKELWRVQHPDYSVAPRPLFDNGTAFIVTGNSKRELWAVRTDGQGDVTDTKVAWKFATHVGKYASPLLVDGLIYTAAEENYVTCIEAATGQMVWTERVGGKFAASPIYADGRLYFFDQKGTTTVLKPGRTLEVLATNTLANGFMASPAVDGKAFILRTKTHLYRVESMPSESK